MSQHWVPAKSVLDAGIKGLFAKDVHPDTLAISSKLQDMNLRPDPLITPIHHSSTYVLPSVDGYLDILQKGGYIYSRLGNPSCEAVEVAINSLEGGAGTLVFSTGMAAITTALTTFLRPGDHIVICQPVYSGTHKFVSKYLSEFKIEATWVDNDGGIDLYRESIKPNTKVLYGETPCNPVMSIQDLEALGSLGKSRGIVTMVDSTFGSPYLQQPIKLGIDISLHSGTKYLSGHSDLVAGVLTTRTLEHWTKIQVYRSTLGNCLSPFDATLLLRGVKTLPVRMDRHSSNAQALAEYLENHPKVAKVHYPGLSSHPGHAIAKKQMKLFGGMITFEMKGGLEAAKKVVENVRIIILAVSLGGTESLMEHPASMTHGPMVMSSKDRLDGNISDGLIRFSVGLEHVSDLIKDLEQAMEKA